MFKILLNNGMYLSIYNHEQLNDMFTKLNIKKVICADNNSKKKIINDYKLQSKQLFDFDPTDENEAYKIFDDTDNKYIFGTSLQNETNGLVYYEPSYIKFIKETVT